MRCLASLLLATIGSIWCSVVQAEPGSLQSLPGEWHQVASSAGRCVHCKIVVASDGRDFTVTASNGWSAVIRPSFQGKDYAAGKGHWEPNVGGSYGGRAFHLNLGFLDDKLLMLMMVPGPNGQLHSVKAVFKKESAPGETF
ncbi:MAG: hypothetical protein J0G28_10175 [Afipia sp.]|nr:hypothetical protein [Afipia sp.]OJW62812.1 MAG: hypothetical protein BGO65_11260 [Afipia sp. 64-13]